MSARKNETIADIIAEKRELADKLRFGTPGLDEIEAAVNLEFDANRIKAAWKRGREEYHEAATSEMLKGATMIDNRSIGNAIINTWKYPLTNLGHRGNQNRGPKTPVAIVRDAEGCVLITFPGEPYRTNAEAIAKASEFCAAMNELHERVGNATTTGNMAALREALKKIGAMEIPHNFQIERSDIVDACYDLTKAIKIANAALSDPPLNCDVGTAEEQGRRCRETFAEWRDKFPNDMLIEAVLKWAQMPYTEGGTNEQG